MKSLIRNILHRLGFDVFRYPLGCEQLEPHLRLLITLRGIDTAIDAGANEGQFALLLRAIDPAMQIHSFEPNPAAFALLRARAEGDARWHVHDCALGRDNGEVVLNIAAAHAFSSCLPANVLGKSEFGRELAPVSTCRVPMRRLDDVMAALPEAQRPGQRLLLKLDTQGADLDVLQGAPRLLAQADVVVTEAALQPIYAGAATFEDLCTLLRTNGFVLSGFFPVSRRADRSVIEADCVFV